jgi:hypothetical protein
MVKNQHQEIQTLPDSIQIKAAGWPWQSIIWFLSKILIKHFL